MFPAKLPRHPFSIGCRLAGAYHRQAGPLQVGHIPPHIQHPGRLGQLTQQWRVVPIQQGYRLDFPFFQLPGHPFHPTGSPPFPNPVDRG